MNEESEARTSKDKKKKIKHNFCSESFVELKEWTLYSPLLSPEVTILTDYYRTASSLHSLQKLYELNEGKSIARTHTGRGTTSKNILQSPQTQLSSKPELFE